MRIVLGTVAAVLLLGYLAYRWEVPVALPFQDGPTTQWRRTVHGWEKVSALGITAGAADPVLDLWNTHPHPAVVSALVALLSLLALVACSPTRSQPTKRAFKLPANGEIELRSRAWLKTT